MLLQPSSHILGLWSTVNQSRLLNRFPLLTPSYEAGGESARGYLRTAARAGLNTANRQSASRFHFKLSSSKMSQGLGEEWGAWDVT